MGAVPLHHKIEKHWGRDRGPIRKGRSLRRNGNEGLKQEGVSTAGSTWIRKRKLVSGEWELFKKRRERAKNLHEVGLDKRNEKTGRRGVGNAQTKNAFDGHAQTEKTPYASTEAGKEQTRSLETCQSEGNNS